MRLRMLAVLVVFVALLGCMVQPGGVAAAIAPNPNPALIARWEPCEPDTGVTVIVDEEHIGTGMIYVGCALGAQANGVESLEHAGFDIEGVEKYNLAFICRIDGEPTFAEQTCEQTPGAGAYWSYWHGKPGGRWNYSGCGAGSCKPAIGDVEGWGFNADGGGHPRIEPMDGTGQHAFTLPPEQESSVIPAMLAREWLTGVTLANVSAIEEHLATIGGGQVEGSREYLERLLSQAQALTLAGVSPSRLGPLAALLAAGCEEHNVMIEGCGLREIYDPKDAAATRLATAVLGLQALGQDTESFAGLDPRGALESMIEPDGEVQITSGGKPTEDVATLAQTVLALARSGTLSVDALTSVDLLLAQQQAGGQFGANPGTSMQVETIQALSAAREQGEDVLGKNRLRSIEVALPKAGEYLESIQELNGDVRGGEANEPRTEPTVLSTSQGALGLALAGRHAAAERAAKWVSSYQVTAEYAGHGNTEAGEHTPAEALIGAFTLSEGELKTALIYGEPTSVGGFADEAQAATWPALLALVTAGPYGPYDATFDQESLFFETRAVGSPSKPLTATVTNNDVRQITIDGVGVSGAQAGDFSVVGGDCTGRTLAPGASCEVSASFDPSTTGLREALLQATLTGTTQTIDMPVTGTGATAPVVVPEQHSEGQSPSPAQQITPTPQWPPAPLLPGGAHPSLRKPESRVQKLARALKQCKREKSKKRRVSCEKQVRKQYAPMAEKTTGKKTIAKKTMAKKTMAEKATGKKTMAEKTTGKKTTAKKRVGKSTVSGFTSNVALAAPSNPTHQHGLDSTVRFLQDAQSSEGGFGPNGSPNEPSDADFTAWVALALAAAGINPQDQARPDGTSEYTYLVEHPGELATTSDFERVLLVVDATGTSPRDFGGVNLVQAILDRQLPEGGFYHEETDHTAAVNDTVFAILALSPIQEPAVQEAVRRAVGWLEDEQNCDGSWPATAARAVGPCPSSGSEPGGETDMTAAAVEALNAASVHYGQYQAKALSFLREAQDPDGGFHELPGEHESNSASTSWAVQGIWSAGENPETWVTSTGKEPLGFLESMQHENGSIQWKASSDENTVFMTAYAGPALAGQPLPYPYVPLSDASRTSPFSGAVEPGDGGESNQPGGGVIAGGGGDGAPLFGRPQPQSKGQTPGGARQLESHDGKTAAKHRRNPGRPRKTPAPTITVEARARRSALTAGHGNGGGGVGEPVVKGVLIGNASNASYQSALELGAPGLRSAGAGSNQTRRLAIGVGVLIALLILVGSQLERRRPRVIL
jgi:prenyltransferase beta subunit